MATIFQKIQELESVSTYSKHEQLVNGIINSIDEKIVERGAVLPSVNNMIRELGFARSTIVKAYSDLKDRGIIHAKNRLGYFVANEDTDQTLKVALILYAFHPIQETFYNAFRAGLGENVQLDIFFHHSNFEILEAIVNNVWGRYGMFVLAPIPHPKMKDLLSVFPENRLLLVDRFEEMGKEVSHVTQEFEISTYEALKELAPTIRNYGEIVLFHRADSDHPREIARAFSQFLKDFSIQGRIESSYIKGMVEKGTVYCTISDGDLWRLLKDCRKFGIRVGEEVGIVSTNDDPVKEIIAEGITTFSTDFEVMGQRAAEFILNRKPTQKTIPTVLVRRNSL
ncbi:MAG: substrate-binding domain-containing protein [Saprospiraceae bacterium]